MIRPVAFIWKQVDLVAKEDGVSTTIMAMVPHARYAALAAKQYDTGEEYLLDEVDERSMASHKQFFAALKSGYDNLPERVFFRTKTDGTFVFDGSGNRIPKWNSPEAYRKWLLIECGFYEEREIEEESKFGASRLAKGLPALLSWIWPNEAYVRIFVRDTKVIIQRAKSQSMAAMKTKQAFEESKKAVLELNDALTGVPPGTHWREAGRSA